MTKMFWVVDLDAREVVAGSFPSHAAALEWITWERAQASSYTTPKDHVLVVDEDMEAA